jgi:hypothetical protein
VRDGDDEHRRRHSEGGDVGQRVEVRPHGTRAGVARDEAVESVGDAGEQDEPRRQREVGEHGGGGGKPQHRVTDRDGVGGAELAEKPGPRLHTPGWQVPGLNRSVSDARAGERHRIGGTDATGVCRRHTLSR